MDTNLNNSLENLLELLSMDISLSRINILFVSHTSSTVIDLADTDDFFVQGNYEDDSESEKPVLLIDKIRDSIIINDLTQYRGQAGRESEVFSELPYLRYKSLLRLPLISTSNHTIAINFWSDKKDSFREEMKKRLGVLAQPFANILRQNMAAITFNDNSLWTPNLPETALLSFCPALVNVDRIIQIVAKSDITVLLLGETGTGKGIVADAICQHSARSGKPYIKVNCGAIPETLIESALFGHEKGSFTGAVSSRPGYFEMAGGGTLFLDEIGEMSMSAQVKLLRVLDSNRIRRIGSSMEIPVDVRIIAASHQNLEKKISEGKFRQDLWYRLAAMPIRIPPLRERLEDIPILLRHFIRTKAHKYELETLPEISESELQGMLKYKWPGNVRELEHAAERLLIRHKLTGQGISNLNFDKLLRTRPKRKLAVLSTAKESTALIRQKDEWPTLKEMQKRYVSAVIRHCSGKLTGSNSASAILDIHYTTLRKYLDREKDSIGKAD